MVGSPEKVEELRKKVAWCPSPILDGEQNSAGEGAMAGQQYFDDVLDTKSQNKEKHWAKNQGIGSIKNRPHSAVLIGRQR